MFEETKAVLTGRLSAIEHDKPILDTLAAGGPNPAQAWQLLMSMESNTLRYFATKEYILSLVDGGSIDSVGDNCVRFSRRDLYISFPGPESKDPYILVTLPGITDLMDQLRRPTPSLPDGIELSITSYAELLSRKGPIPARVRARFPHMQEANGFCCYLFYFFHAAKRPI